MKITNVCWSRSGAGFRIFAGAGAGVELGKKFDRLRNLVFDYECWLNLTQSYA